MSLLTDIAKSMNPIKKSLFDIFVVVSMSQIYDVNFNIQIIFAILFVNKFASVIYSTYVCDMELEFKAPYGKIVKTNYDLEFFYCNGSMGPETNLFDLGFRQYIGIKDKNGNKIYHCDHIKHNNNIYIIKWSENQFCFLAKIVGSDTNWRSLEWVNRVSKYIEIINP